MRGKDIEARMLDVSQGGMAMVTNYDIPVSTILSMRFTVLKVDKEIINFSGPLEVTGEVRSNVPAERDEHRLGIYFTKIKKINVLT
jgi:c-di-GMP-binding flagellar brake protein YcgR